MALWDDLKNKPWVRYAALPVAGGLIYFMFFWNPARPPKSPAPAARPQALKATGKAAEKNAPLYSLRTQPWQNRVDQDIDVLKGNLSEIKKKEDDLTQKLGELNKNLSDLLKQKKEEEIKPIRPAAKPPVVFPEPQPSRSGAGGIIIRRFQSLGAGAPVVSKNALKKVSTGPTAYLPAGSMASSLLLNGVDAPIGAKSFPVLLALKEAFYAPNSYRVPLKGCFILGKAEGDASSERANIQVIKLSCVLSQSRVFERDVSGYVISDDGKEGIPGRLVAKESSKVALAAVAGVASGLARAFSQTQATNVVTSTGAVTSTVTGSALKFGVGSGAEGLAQELQRYFERESSRFVPVIEIEAGKPVTAVMLGGVAVPELSTGKNGGVASGLD